MRGSALPQSSMPARMATRSASFRPSLAAVADFDLLRAAGDASSLSILRRDFLDHCSSEGILKGRGIAMATSTQPQSAAKPAASLSKEEILRYSRHLIMPEV